MDANWSDVRFDYPNSLVLARRLWEVADELDALATQRRLAGTEALVDWLGPLGVEFAARIDTETRDLGRLAGELRAGAHGWAQAWANALNEQNRRLFARACEVVRSRRSSVDRFVGFFAGHDDLPPEPYHRPPPTAPRFLPTGAFARYRALA